MAQDHATLSPALRDWKYTFLKNADPIPKEGVPKFNGVQAGETQGWNATGFDDSAWETTDIGMDSWSDLGFLGNYGTMWYRRNFQAPELKPDKKIYLWLAATDGSAKVYVNGKAAPFRNAEGEETEQALGFAVPFAFDVTDLVKSGTDNQITIAATREFINELGTGGLLGPVYLFQEK